jgi:hypothetical protein
MPRAQALRQGRVNRLAPGKPSNCLRRLFFGLKLFVRRQIGTRDVRRQVQPVERASLLSQALIEAMVEAC